jgi:hypothetical protein
MLCDRGVRLPINWVTPTRTRTHTPSLRAPKNLEEKAARLTNLLSSLRFSVYLPSIIFVCLFSFLQP